MCTTCHSKENALDMEVKKDKVQTIIDSFRISSKVNGVQFCIIDSIGATQVACNAQHEVSRCSKSIYLLFHFLIIICL